MASNVECPTDFVLVNENKVRLTALSTLVITVIYLITGHWVLPAFLVVDFFLRAFNFGRYSVLNLISEKLVNIFNISAKPIDQAPKRFAAKIGFIFSAAILTLTILNYTTGAILLAIILAVFAFLESFVGFCAGCYVYTFYIKLFKKNKRPISK